MTRCATSTFLLLFILLLQSSRASNHGLNDELNFIHQEIGLLRDENQIQNKEIAMLREMAGFQNNNKTISDKIVSQITKELDDEKNMKESPSIKTRRHQNSASDTNHQRRRIKRPYRLLPGSGKKINDSKDDADSNRIRFYGPPTNCSDLSQLGFTLNGFYLVQSSHSNLKNDDGLKTKSIYCAFKQPEGTFNKNAVEKRVNDSFKLDAGSMSRSSPGSGVHFLLRSNKLFKMTSPGSIQFDIIDLNMGSGCTNGSGVFTAPKSGIYQFFFSGMMSSSTAKPNDPYLIILCVNCPANQLTHYTVVGDNLQFYRYLQSTIKLHRGDKVKIWIQRNDVTSSNNFGQIDLQFIRFAWFNNIISEAR